MNYVGMILAGRYEILEKVGEGGMAVVYKARCNLLNRFVAVKILKDEYSKDESFVERFRAEARSAAALTHPNIVSVYDVGSQEGINYIVMELLETKTLKDYIQEMGPFSNDLVLKIAAQIASALEAAHKAHIVHRDIKPQNIVLNKNMVAKVTDFGIAKIANTTAATITSFGSTMGSVHYFSPEQAKGGYTDEKSDIYSLGVVMYEMATGTLPFDGDSPVAVALKHIQEEPEEPRKINPNISNALNQIILKAMAKSTTIRYHSATELIRDISQALVRPNSMIVRPESSVEAGATQVIPTLDVKEEDDLTRVPNLRTKQTQATGVRSRSGEERNTPNFSTDEHQKKKEPLTKKKKIVIAVVAVVAVIFIGCGVYFGIKINRKIQAENAAKTEIDVPKVIGRKMEEAVEEYAKQGIEIIQDKSDYNDEYEEGYICAQTPGEGEKTKDKKIYVTVSKGKKMVKVTDVTGKDIKVAKYELEDTYGFKIEQEDVINEKVAAGIIISQEPKEGTELAYGSTIKLTVSKGDGKETVLMPTVLGKTEADAKKILEDKKLTVKVNYSEDNAKSNGVVLSQSYPENQELKEGTLVEITVNKLLITKNISLDLQDLQGGAPLEVDKITVKVTASIDSGATNTIFEKSFDPKDKTTSLSINGYQNAVLKIYLNGNLVKEQTIEF